jgi:diguanylate cyclase (GGDEF)-like protein
MIFLRHVIMKKNSIEHALKDELYLPFVESLYSNLNIVAFGAVVQAMVAYTIYKSTNDLYFIGFSIAFLIGGLARLWLSYRYYETKKTKNDISFGQKWEKYYSIGVNSIGFLIGLQTYLAIRSGDDFAEVSSLALAMATMVTIVGKNFASARIVHLFTLFLFTPIMIGLLSKGDWRHTVFAFILIPFGFLISSMSRYVRDFLQQAIKGKLDIKVIANQFDVAINNMPQGLFLFNEYQKSLIANNRATIMFKAATSEMLINRDLKSLIRYARLRKIFDPLNASLLQTKLLNMITLENNPKFTIQTYDQHYLEFTVKRIQEGSAVILFEDITERVKAEEHINHMARFDALTSLANRTYFKELVQNTLEQTNEGCFAAFIVIDIDDFKHVNDSMGHLTGDALLSQFAKRVAALADQNTCFSRFGGDEFVGFLSNHVSERAAEQSAYDTLNALIGQYNVAGHTLSITVSAGIVIAPATHVDLAKLMIKADLALYESKNKGMGTYTVFAPSMDDTYQRRQRLKQDLKTAIMEKKIDIFYQPIIDANTLKISMCEALCRWHHEDLGSISPAVFIPLAEETGLITNLTEHVLEQACRDCTTWNNNISVSVNLSAMDFKNTNLQDTVRSILEKTQLEPSRLELEVTESAILEDQTGASFILSALRGMGITTALDDFGTGYSSLSYLHNLPLNKVKIDRSFVKNIVNDSRSLKLVRGVTRLADELGLKITVEGIETVAQFEQLREHASIDLAQGFLFGAALSQRGIATLIDENMIAHNENPTLLTYKNH